MTIFNTTLPLFLLTFVFSALPVFAESSPTTKPRQNHQEDRQEIKQEKKDDQLERRLTITQENLNQRRQNALKIAAKIRLQLTKHFDYLTKIKTRLETKINNPENKRDMTAAKAKLATYDTTKYTQDLAKFNTVVASISTSDKPASVIPSLRVAAKAVLTDLQVLHRHLIDTLKLIVKAPKK